MDTTYYRLNARRVKVSGGTDLVTFVPAPAAAPAGEVLDFERCRRKLETKAALERLEADPAEEAPRAPERRPRRERWAGILELCASAAVIAVSLAAVWAFLHLA